VALEAGGRARERRKAHGGEPSDEVIEREIRIEARPETVFAFFTDPEKMIRWKGIQATLDARPGGIYRVDMNGKDVARGVYLEVEPPTRVVFSWGWESEESHLPPGSSRVEITLTPDGDGTRVRLRHLDLPKTHVADHAAGWDTTCAAVEAGAGRDPGPDPWAVRAEELSGSGGGMNCVSIARVRVETITPATAGAGRAHGLFRKKDVMANPVSIRVIGKDATLAGVLR